MNGATRRTFRNNNNNGQLSSALQALPLLFLNNIFCWFRDIRGVALSNKEYVSKAFSPQKVCLIISTIISLNSFYSATAFSSTTSQVGDKITADKLHKEGLQHFNTGQYREALDDWLREFSIDNKNANTANNIGIAYRKLMQHSAAIRYHGKSIELNPAFGKAHNSLGIVYYEMKEYDKALLSYQKALDLKFDPGCMHYNIGLVYCQLNEYEKAKSHTLIAIELKYNLAASYANLATIYSCQGDHKGAEAALRKSIEIGPTPQTQARLSVIAKRNQEERFSFIAGTAKVLLIALLAAGSMLSIIFVILKNKEKIFRQYKSNGNYIVAAKRVILVILFLFVVSIAYVSYSLGFTRKASHDIASALRNLVTFGTISNSDKIAASLQDNSPQVRRKAVQALSLRREAQASVRIIKALYDEDPAVRKAAAEGLFSQEIPQAVPPLITCLKDRNSEVRGMAARTLGSLQDSRALEPLIAALDEKEPQARHWIIVAITGLYIYNKPPVDYILAALKSDNADVREGAAEVLAELHAPSESVGLLVAALKDERPMVRVKAAKALYYAKDPVVVPPLVLALKDKNADVRAQAAAALIDRNDHQIYPALVDALSDSDAKTRRWAAQALGNMKDKRAVDSLIAVLHDEDAAVIVSAIMALEEIKDRRAVGALAEALGNKDPKVRIRAALALGILQDIRAVEPLIETLMDDNAVVREKALWALTSLTGKDLGKSQNAWKTWWVENKMRTQADKR